MWPRKRPSFGLDSDRAVRLYDRFLKKAPKQSRSRSVVESVLSAATELLGRHDDEDEVTIQAVAERAGVGVGSLYDYFVDRGSVFSGLAAKLTEDNLRRFEAELDATKDQPLEVAIRRAVDLLWNTYLADVRIPRIVLRIAHRTNLMPALSANHELFGKTLARSLRNRSDLDPAILADLEAATYTITNMMMGVVGTLVFAEQRPFPDEVLKAECVRVCVRYLTPR